MSNEKTEFLLKYFGDRFVLLKDDWLNSAIDFLHNRIPAARSYSNGKFADLIFEQWKCSDFESTSFPVFANYGIEPSTSKMELPSPLVCQINSIIDIGSSYYSQYCKLGDKSREDNTGFEKVFEEKEDDNDKKPSRLLKLTLSDGETSLHAIEFFKIPFLSMYIKPGCKIVISPPVTIRKGTFLLKPGNCQILGGECLPLLNSQRPFDLYARLLKLEVSEKDTNSPSSSQAVSNVNTMTDSSRNCSVAASQGRDFDSHNDIEAFENYMENFYESPTPSPPRRSLPRRRSPSPVVTVTSFSSRMGAEVIDAPRTINKSRQETISPIRKKVRTSDMNNTSSLSGMLTSRRNDPRDEILENMIEENEEPISFNRKSDTKLPDWERTEKTEVKMKPIKTEKVDNDDEIEIIELVTPPPPPPSKKDGSFVDNSFSPTSLNESDETKKDDKLLSREEKAAIDAFSKMKLAKIGDCVRKMKYCIGSRRFEIMGIVVDILEPLRVVDNLWTMKISMKDSSELLECFVDNQTLENLIGFTCRQAIEIRQSSDMEKRKDGKRRLNALENQLQRLDLVFEVEFFNESSSVPVIRTMKTLAERLDAY